MAVVTQTGNQASSLSIGMLTGTEPLARLQRDDLANSVSFKGTLVDDTPVWTWFTQSITDACELDNFLDSDPQISGDPDIDTEVEALRCIKQHKTEEIFKPEIVDSPRLALVPELHQTAWPSGGKYVSFKSFTFVYIQSLFGNCNAQKGTCDTVFVPGEPDLFEMKNGNADVTSMTVIGLPDISLPQAVRDQFLDPEWDIFVLIR